MDIEEAKKQLLKHKKEIDTKCISARYSKAIEVVLSELEKEDKIINEIAEYISKLDIDDEICSKNTTNPEYCNEDYTNCKSV